MKLNLFFKFLKKYEIIILLILILFVICHFSNVIEGLTSCTQAYDCSSCVNARINDTNNPCYWSSLDNKCGSFDDPGYSRSCSADICSRYTSCSTCVNGKVNGNPCYWSNSNGGSCSSTRSSGYSNTCTVSSCMDYTDCSLCVNGKAGSDNHLCYWNGNANPGYKCSGFPSLGYLTTCQVTSCGDYKDCSSCVTGKENNRSCYWNSSNNQCGSSTGNGYSQTCPSCPSCPRLILLKNPTYITEQ
jgi:hypothetical protein